MSTWQERAHAKEREQTLRNNIRYRLNLREVNRSQQSLDRLCDQYTAQAVEAEKAGNHPLAVRLAAEAARLKKHQAVTGGMRGAMEIAHAVQSANQAMADMMKVSRSAAGSLLEGAAMPDMYALQTDLASMQEQVSDFMEESGMLYEDMTSISDPHAEEGEKYLKTLMSSRSTEKQHKLLQDTNARLEKLQRSRPTENERSKQA